MQTIEGDSPTVFGRVLCVAIRAINVGTVEIKEEVQRPRTHLSKGDEVGLFQFGGLSIIVVFEKGRDTFDEHLVSMSSGLTMMDVEVGMSLELPHRDNKLIALVQCLLEWICQNWSYL